MKYILSLLLLTVIKVNSQNDSFYKNLNFSGTLKMYSQINENPVLISNGNILSENSLPDYTRGLQFMQAPGVFNSVDELYNYLTNNNDFYFENYEQAGSYYNKTSSHNEERELYYSSGIRTYNKSLSYSDEEAIQSGVWDLISNIKYQLVYRETYIKEDIYEFLLLGTINAFKADIDVDSSSDIEKGANYFLRNSIDEEEILQLRSSAGSYAMIKEDGRWKACSASAVFKYLKIRRYLSLVKQKLNSNNFYDVLSTVENETRIYTEN